MGSDTKLNPPHIRRNKVTHKIQKNKKKKKNFDADNLEYKKLKNFKKKKQDLRYNQ